MNYSPRPEGGGGAISNSHPMKSSIDIATISTILCAYTLLAIYGTNNVTNNTADLLAPIAYSGFVLPSTPIIIVYNSMVVHTQHLSFIGKKYTNH